MGAQNRDRWIKDVFHAFSKISVVFAENGPGKLPENQVNEVELAYLQYRENYNSNLVSLQHDPQGFNIFREITTVIWFLYDMTPKVQGSIYVQRNYNNNLVSRHGPQGFNICSERLQQWFGFFTTWPQRFKVQYMFREITTITWFLDMTPKGSIYVQRRLQQWFGFFTTWPQRS